MSSKFRGEDDSNPRFSKWSTKQTQTTYQLSRLQVVTWNHPKIGGRVAGASWPMRTPVPLNQLINSKNCYRKVNWTIVTNSKSWNWSPKVARIDFELNVRFAMTRLRVVLNLMAALQDINMSRTISALSRS